MYKDNIFMEEAEKLINSSKLGGITTTNEGFKVSEIKVDGKLGKNINRNRGLYTTITFDNSTISKNLEEFITLIKEKLESMLKFLSIKKGDKVLFVGLGNKEVTSDKLGYLTIEKIAVSNKVYKIYKDVYASTNIKSSLFIKSLVSALDARLVIIIDSLLANNIERLGNTLQLSTGGLNISSKKEEISKSTIKCNVISIGVPTLINLKNIKVSNPNLLVTTNEIDRIVEDLSSILSIVINRIF